jgi:Protein of unknown function (DUF4011)
VFIVDEISPDIESKIESWKERLSGLGRKNDLLKFVGGNGKTIQLRRSASAIFKQLVIEEMTLSLSPDEIEESLDPIKTLKKLRKGAAEVQREKGVNSLFIAIGTLSWQLKGETKIQTVSPILLIPVELQKVRRRDEYTIVAIGEDPILNPILVQKLDADYGIPLQPIPSGQSLTCDTLLDQVRQDVAQFTRWTIEPVAHLALFERPKAAMLNDLEEYAARVAQHPILRGLANDLSGYEPQNYSIPEVKQLDQQHPRSVFQVLDADSSQQVVIEAAKNGLSFITQGPPGTGKSQTIAGSPIT